MGTLIHKVAHGLIADQRVYLVNLVGGLGLDSTELYFVLAAGLTANDFAVSLTSGGAAVVYTTDITDGAIVTNDTYASVSDGNMSPPTAPSAPGSCVLTSDAQLQPDGSVITRLIVTVTQPTSATLRNTIVTVIGGANSAGTKVVIPVGLTEGSIASVIPGVSYVGTAISYDTFGLASPSTTSAAHVAAGDVTAPAQVTGANALNGILGVSLLWSASASTDLAYYEVQIDTVNTFGSATTYKTKSTLVSITPLAAGTWFMRVRAIDLTGNAGTYSSTVSAVARVTDAVTNVGATVTIDSGGLTILNGAMTIQDANGASVLTSSGFAGPWLDFIHLGLYNARFLQGVVGTIANGTTSACPYWTFSNLSGAPTATFVSGGGVKVVANVLAASKRLLSALVPIRPGAEYAVTVAFSAVVVAGFESVTSDIFWYKADGTTAASVANDGGLTQAGAGATVSVTSFDVGLAKAPPDAMYARVSLAVAETISHNAGNSITLAAIGLTEAPPKNLMDGSNPSQRYVNDLEVNGTLSVDSNIVAIGTVTYPNMGLRVLRASNLTVTGANVSTIIPFNGTEDWDTYNLHSVASNTGNVVVDRSGKWMIICSAHCAPVATLPTRLIIELFINGVAYTIGGIAGTGQRLTMPNAQTFDQHMQGTWVANLAANDIISIHTEHNSATSQTVKAAELICIFMGN